MRWLALLAAGLSVSCASVAQADDLSGVEVGFRTGYSVQYGNLIVGNTAVQGAGCSPDGSSTNGCASGITGAIPLWLDIGYRSHGLLFVGVFAQYQIAMVNTSVCTGCAQYVDDLLYGIEAIVHTRPDRGWDPWFGIGAGHETTVGQLADAQGGVDFQLLRVLSVGPFVAVSLGGFQSNQLQGWVTLGAKTTLLALP